MGGEDDERLTIVSNNEFFSRAGSAREKVMEL